MAVDASKLKRRRGLGAPPTEGAPGIEEAAPPSAEPDTAPTKPFTPVFLRHEYQERRTAERAGQGTVAAPSDVEPSPGAATVEPSPLHHEEETAAVAQPEPLGMELEGKAGAEPEPVPVRQATAARSRGEEFSAAARRQRVPPPEAEPRVPFTTRVTLSTKERLEDACYHLRRKHQDFINEAILAHLEKHGF